MGQIHLANAKGRNALVTTEAVASALEGRWLDVFTPDAEYNAFGTAYTLERFPALLEADLEPARGALSETFYRDLQRRRMLTCQWQGLTPDLGAGKLAVELIG